MYRKKCRLWFLVLSKMVALSLAVPRAVVWQGKVHQVVKVISVAPTTQILAKMAISVVQVLPTASVIQED